MNDNAQTTPVQSTVDTTTPVTPTTTAPSNNNNATNYDEIFNKLDSILEKRVDGIAKSALKDNGYEDDEMKDILAKYRLSKEEKDIAVNEQLKTLQTENEKLKDTYQKEKLNNEAITLARTLNVDDKTIPYLIKLADMSKCIDEKGQINTDNVKKSLEKVLSDVPSLKKVEQSRAGVIVGADTQSAGNPSGNLFNFGFTGVRKHE